MDPNKSAVWIALITSVTTIVLALIALWNQRQLSKKVDVGNALTDSVHTTVNGNNDRLQKQLADAHAEIARLNLMRQPPQS